MNNAPQTTVAVLYVAGCPNYRPTLELARAVVAELGVEVAADGEGKRGHDLTVPAAPNAAITRLTAPALRDTVRRRKLVRRQKGTEGDRRENR